MESLRGVEGLFYYRVGQGKLVGDLLLGSLPFRESTHTNSSCVSLLGFSRVLNAEMADVKAL